MNHSSKHIKKTKIQDIFSHPERFTRPSEISPKRTPTQIGVERKSEALMLFLTKKSSPTYRERTRERPEKNARREKLISDNAHFFRDEARKKREIARGENRYFHSHTHNGQKRRRRSEIG